LIKTSNLAAYTRAARWKYCCSYKTSCHNKGNSKAPSLNPLKSDTFVAQDYDADMRKIKLFILVENCQPRFASSINKVWAAGGFALLRLPMYHPDVTSTGIIWNNVKIRIAGGERELAHELYYSQGRHSHTM
jgi:hypothetical protein